MKRHIALAVFSTLALVALSSLPAAAQVAAGTTYTYTITDLGTLGGTQSGANSINNIGQVAGWAYTVGGMKHAFLWTLGGIDGVSSNPRMKDLGTLPDRDSSVANGVNNSGLVVGTSYVAGSGNSGGFVWNCAMTHLAVVGGTYSYANGINDSDQIAGLVNIGSQDHAWLWQGGSSYDLHTIPGAIETESTAINGAGQVVGRYYGSGGPGTSHAVLWLAPTTDATQVQYLPEPAGYIRSFASSVNDSGQVLGTATDAGGAEHFTVWNTNDNSLQYCGILDSWCGASSINNLGEAVGFACAVQGSHLNYSYRAIRWAKEVGLEDLNTSIDGSNPFTKLGGADAINDNGIIVGTTVIGVEKGTPRAFMLTPIRPVPGFSPADLVPNSLSATTTSSSVTLTWAYPTGPNPTRFRIDEKGADGRWIKVVTTLSGSARSYTVTRLTKGTLYYFRVRAENVSGTSVYVSNFAVVSATPH